MAKAEISQKVKLDPSGHKKGLKDLASNTKREMEKVNKEFNQAGNAVGDFANRSKKKSTEIAGTFNDLVKGISSGLKGLAGLSIPAIAAGVGAAALSAASAGEDRTAASRKTGFRESLSDEQTSAFKSAVLDASSAANASPEIVEEAANVALGFEASTRESVKFAEVIAKTSRLLEGLDVQGLSEFVASDIRERGGDVTGQGAEEIVNALIVGSRSGFKDVGEALSSLESFDSRQLKDAGVSIRDLVNTLGALRTTRGIDPGKADAFVKDILKINDTLGEQAVKGILGTSFTDSQGRLQITEENLAMAQKKLGGLGGREVQREVLRGVNFSDEGIDTLLGASQNRTEFTSQRQKISGDDANLDQAFDTTTKTFGELFTSTFRSISNALQKDLFIVNENGISSPGADDLGKGDDLNDVFSEVQRRQANGTLGAQNTPGDKAQTVEGGGNAKEITVKSVIEIQKAPPGFTAKPVSTELNRDARGI